MSVKARRLFAVVGGLIAGAGVGVVVRGVHFGYDTLPVFGGVLFGLGLGIMVAVSLRGD